MNQEQLERYMRFEEELYKRGFDAGTQQGLEEEHGGVPGGPDGVTAQVYPYDAVSRAYAAGWKAGYESARPHAGTSWLGVDLPDVYLEAEEDEAQ